MFKKTTCADLCQSPVHQNENMKGKKIIVRLKLLPSRIEDSIFPCR